MIFEKAGALLFDLFGTLVSYDLDDEIPVRELHRSLNESGLGVSYEVFRGAYVEARSKYRVIRYEKLEEVTNSVWLSDALERLGRRSKVDEQGLANAVEAAFKPFSESTSLLHGSLEVLVAASRRFRIGLVTNFTYAPVVHTVTQRLGMKQYFQAIAISHEVGFRKPHPRIFEDALRALGIEPAEAVMVGNDPFEDISGAKRLGMGAVLVKSSKYFEDEVKSLDTSVKPDAVIQSIGELKELL